MKGSDMESNFAALNSGSLLRAKAIKTAISVLSGLCDESFEEIVIVTTKARKLAVAERIIKGVTE